MYKLTIEIMKILNEHKIVLEFGINGAKAYKRFLKELTDANYHDLKQSIESQLNDAIYKRNAKK